MSSSGELVLRIPPPPESLRWVEAAVDRGARVTSVRRLPGGISTTMHALTVAHGDRTKRVVLRRFVLADWIAREPDIASREASALHLLENTDVPAPRLLAVDEDGSAAGVPSVLMTRLPGKTVLIPGDMDSWVRQMAEALPAIHAIRPTPGDLPWRWKPYNDVSALQVPAWAERRNEWERALALARGPAPQSAEHLIHRDYHPANVLWVRRRISGIVDWVNACRGPAGVDVGHCRRNLALLHGVEVADRFLDHCRERADYNPYWDIITLTDWLPGGEIPDGWRDLGLDLTTDVVRSRADEYVASLVVRL